MSPEFQVVTNNSISFEEYAKVDDDTEIHEDHETFENLNDNDFVDADYENEPKENVVSIVHATEASETLPIYIAAGKCRQEKC